jgi:hypothetical protein
MTREHVIPRWYLDPKRNRESTNFLERAPTRWVNSDFVVRDVCQVCNGGSLSQLDEYARDTWRYGLRAGDSERDGVVLSADYKLLARWLLKVSFNSARAHNTDLNILADYAAAILGTVQLPNDLIVFVNSVADYGSFNASDYQDSYNNSAPTWFRIGVFRVPGFHSDEWCFRHVYIDSLAFFLCIPRRSAFAVDREKLLEAIRKRAEDFGVEMQEAGRTFISGPSINAERSLLRHSVEFPFAYGLARHEVVEHLLKSSEQIIQFAIPRSEIEAFDLSPTLSFLNDISSCRELALSFQARVEFSISGYDDDSRELYEIDEVVRFLVNLNAKWNFWMLFQLTEGVWIQVLGLCLSGATRQDTGQALVDKERFSNVLHDWINGLRIICERFAISQEIRQSAEASALGRMQLSEDEE